MPSFWHYCYSIYTREPYTFFYMSFTFRDIILEAYSEICRSSFSSRFSAWISYFWVSSAFCSDFLVRRNTLDYVFDIGSALWGSALGN